MIELQDIIALKELGIGVIAMFVFYKFASKVTDNATNQMTQLHIDFLGAYKENTKALQEMFLELREHRTTKDKALSLLEERYRKDN